MEEKLDAIEVLPYFVEHVSNDYPLGELPWQVYHTVRNDIVDACLKHGSVGAMGKVKIVADVEDPYLMTGMDPSFWERGEEQPMYYVIEDQRNHERYCYVELDGKTSLNADWLWSICSTLRKHDGWGIGVIGIPYSYILIFSNLLLVSGRLSNCRFATEVVQIGQRLFDSANKRWWQFWR